MARTPAAPVTPNRTPTKRARRTLDVSTFLGLALSFAGVVGGLLLERGKIEDITQLTAAIIVFGGTFGAVLVSCSLPVVLRAGRRFLSLLFHTPQDHTEMVEEIVRLATKARRSGMLSLEDDLETISDPHLRKAVSLYIDGVDMLEMRRMMELAGAVEDSRHSEEARVYESAGGFAPTIGIIGAVLGLIQVMKNLEQIEEVGKGIAVAFVATVYGVASANLVFLPFANKIRAAARQSRERRQLILEGVCSLAEGVNPRLIRSKLEAFSPTAAPVTGSRPVAAPAPATATLTQEPETVRQ